MRPRWCHSSFETPLREGGAGKTGCLPHPRSRVPMHTAKTHTSIQVRREHPGLPCAVALLARALDSFWVICPSCCFAACGAAGFDLHAKQISGQGGCGFTRCAAFFGATLAAPDGAVRGAAVDAARGKMPALHCRDLTGAFCRIRATPGGAEGAGTSFHSNDAGYRDHRGVPRPDRERVRSPARTAFAERQLADRDRRGNVALATEVATARRVDIGLHHSHPDRRLA